jgi:hypothetical protein
MWLMIRAIRRSDCLFLPQESTSPISPVKPYWGCAADKDARYERVNSAIAGSRKIGRVFHDLTGVSTRIQIQRSTGSKGAGPRGN